MPFNPDEPLAGLKAMSPTLSPTRQLSLVWTEVESAWWYWNECFAAYTHVTMGALDDGRYEQKRERAQQTLVCLQLVVKEAVARYTEIAHQTNLHATGRKARFHVEATQSLLKECQSQLEAACKALDDIQGKWLDITSKAESASKWPMTETASTEE